MTSLACSCACAVGALTSKCAAARAGRRLGFAHQQRPQRRFEGVTCQRIKLLVTHRRASHLKPSLSPPAMTSQANYTRLQMDVCFVCYISTFIHSKTVALQFKVASVASFLLQSSCNLCNLSAMFIYCSAHLQLSEVNLVTKAPAARLVLLSRDSLWCVVAAAAAAIASPPSSRSVNTLLITVRCACS